MDLSLFPLPLQQVNFCLELRNPLELDFLVSDDGVEQITTFIEPVDEVVELLTHDPPAALSNRLNFLHAAMGGFGGHAGGPG